ncbi:Pvc16 family protein [Reinekea sp.]|uniref:Pvc16 family protein n=1 Tax=Reinekea sp. TaxID=1970455 RepID=UPI002A804611|nr:Pvc16 family protein [Reinekea sp.]
MLQQDGSFPQKNQNKMVITLINLDHETTRAYSTTHRRLSDGSFAKTESDALFNVTLLFTASFDDYEEALKFLNATIAFFQATPSFNSKVTPGLPKGIKALNFDIENTSFSETHNLWSAMGAKYQPSII